MQKTCLDLLEKALATSSSHLIELISKIPFFIGLVLNSSSLKNESLKNI